MQVKKDEVKNSILNSGEKEFYKNGFKNASIRKIVKNAGTTIGNFYNYFESKEALFEELVRDEYNNFCYFIQNHDKIQRPDYLWDTPNVNDWRNVLYQLLQHIMPTFSDRLVLLVECSEGTKYENVREIIVNLAKEHFIEHMERFDSNYVDTALAEIISEQLLNGIILILKKHKDEKVRKQLITEHLLFYFLGTMGLLGSW